MRILKVRDNKGGFVDSLVDDDIFDEVSKHSWCIKNGYAGRSARDGKKQLVIKLHRWIMGVTDPSICVDHINHDKLDNRRENLRTCTHTENMQNKTANSRGVSHFKGVTLDSRKKKKKWRATIVVNKKQIYLGMYLTEEEASEAYNNAATKYFGEFASLNKL